MARSRRSKRNRTPVPQHIKQLVFGVCLAIVIIGFGYTAHTVTRLPRYAVTEVVVVEETTIDAVAVEELVREELAGSYLQLIPRNFAYTLPKRSIQNTLKSVPRIKDVTLTRSGAHTLEVAFAEYVPVALWCNGSDSECLFVDAAGYAFAAAPQLSGGSLLRIRQDEVPLSVGRKAVTPELLAHLQEFTDIVEEQFGFVVAYADITYPGDIVYGLYNDGRLLTSEAYTAEETLENLATILNSEEFMHLRAEQFNYIDLRYGSKVFVNEEIAVPEVASSTATSSLQLQETNTEQREYYESATNQAEGTDEFVF